MSWYMLAVIPVFGLLVFVHELGHFLAAKWAGIRVEEFALGFPPTVVSLRKREQGGWEVIWFGKGGDTEASSPQNPFTATSGGVSKPGATRHHTLYSLGLLPIGGFVRMPGENGDVTDGEGNYDPDSFAAKSAGKRTIVLIAGVVMNFLLAMVLFGIAYSLGEPVPVSTATLGEIKQGSPAEIAGLRTDDLILSVNGHAVKSFTDMSTQVRKAIKADNNRHDTVPVTLVVRHAHENQPVTLVVNARAHASPDQGAMGVGVKYTYDTVPLWQAPIKGITATFDMLRTFLSLIGQMIIGLLPLQLSGPVGVAKVTGQVAQATVSIGWFPILSLTALLSINIAIFNILPFPALDGGRVVLVLIEVLRGGKRLKPEREGLINLVGFAFLLLLMVVVTVSDVMHWRG